MNYRALCFVDMPFGKKPDLKSGVVVDFDQIYNEAIKPAIEDCDGKGRGRINSGLQRVGASLAATPPEAL
jgi:hypothetical protein